VDVNVTEGTVSVYAYDAALRDLLLKEGGPAVPSDADLFAAAERYIAAHGIPRAGYGAPMVLDSGTQVLETVASDNAAEETAPAEPAEDAGASDTSVRILPAPDFAPVRTTMEVLYPLVVNGRPVFFPEGRPVGMQLSIDLASMSVMSLTGLVTQHYEASTYPAETDETALRAVMERGGVYGYAPEDAGSTVEITLGSPALGLVQLYQYDQEGPRELYAPALVFPITDVPEGESYWQDRIVVPLVRELLPGTSGGRAVPEPVPLDIKATP
jgi:hypothetical protein